MFDRSRITRVAALLPLVASLAACEVKNPLEDVNVILNITDAPISLSAIPALGLVAGQVSQRTGTVNTQSPVESVNSVSAIKLAPAFFGFTPTAPAPAAGMAAGSNSVSGTVLVTVRSGTTPLVAVTLTIVNNVVTAVDPSVATLASMAAAYRSKVDAAIAANPSLAGQFGSYQGLTADQLLANINAVLTSAQSNITVVATVLSGDVTGSLSISQFTVDGQVTADRP